MNSCSIIRKGFPSCKSVHRSLVRWSSMRSLSSWTKLKISNNNYVRLLTPIDHDSRLHPNFRTLHWRYLSNTAIEKSVVLGRLQDEFYRINIENIIQIICNHVVPSDPNQQLKLFSQPISYSANINPQYYQYGLGTVGHLKVEQSQESRFRYQIRESKTNELVIDGQITTANEDLKLQNPHTFYTYPITVRPSDISITKQVHITQYLCFAMSAIKHAIASKFNDGYMEFMDKTWYSKAIHFKLDYHSPAYVNENLTVKSWSDASNNRINCQIMRENDCLSTFSISFNPDLKYTPGILPLSLDVIHKDIFGIIFNGENFLSIRNRFNQPDISKFTNAAAEAFTTSLIYGVWNVSKFFSRSKGAMLLITSKFDIDPMFYTMQPDAPTKLKLGLESMGNKSFMSAYRIIDYQTKTVINKCENISVFVKDGKPEALPEQFKEELLQKVPVKALTEKPQPLFESIPQNHFTYHTKVRASDLDYNNHVGYGGVVGFCLDAASNAASSKSSAYRFDFGNDFNPSCIHQKFLLLRGQLLFDDEITVDTWQGYENNSLYFNVRKENKAVCQLEFIIDVQSIQKCN